MNQKRWKKLVGIILIIGVLVLSFWYGGNAPGLQGFSVNSNSEANLTADNNSSATDAQEADGISSNYNDVSEKNIENGDSTKTDNTDKTDSVKNDSGNKQKKSFLSGIIMKIKKTGTSGSKKKNLQVNKKAQKNANKSVNNSKKSKKKNIVSKSSKSNKKDNATNDSKENNSKIADGSIDNNDGNASENNDKVSDAKTDYKNDGSEEKSDVKAAELEAEDDVDDANSITCQIYISCATVLDHMDNLSDATKKIIPEDGVILNLTPVKVKKDATVFDVLQKAARQNKVHLEYNYTPAYKTYYIEGIGNLYQFDAGNLSGWMYSVNDEFPGVGCSGYRVKDGDSISWLYTCSFGKDVGGYVPEE